MHVPIGWPPPRIASISLKPVEVNVSPPVQGLVPESRRLRAADLEVVVLPSFDDVLRKPGREVGGTARGRRRNDELILNFISLLDRHQVISFNVAHDMGRKK
jgi:hypothetical protein